jgi:hypothetical protein
MLPLPQPQNQQQREDNYHWHYPNRTVVSLPKALVNLGRCLFSFEMITLARFMNSNGPSPRLFEKTWDLLWRNAMGGGWQLMLKSN